MDGKIEYLKLPIIVDIGSGEVKAGFSGEEKPKTIFNMKKDIRITAFVRVFDLCLW